MKQIDVKELFKILGTTVKINNINKNHTLIMYENGTVLYSYNTMVAAHSKQEWYFTKYHNYSVTTSKWVNKYCKLNSQERNKLLYEEKAILVKY